MAESIKTALDLRAERRNTAERMREILEAPADGERLDAQQEQEFDRLHERQNELLERIKEIESSHEEQKRREEIVKGLESELAKPSGARAGNIDTDTIDRATKGEPVDESEARYNRAFDAYLRYGMGALNSDAQQALMQRSGGGMSNVPEEVRAMSVAADTAGGFFVPEGFLNQVIEARLNYGGMRRSRATVLSTASGQDLPIPTDNDTTNSGAILTENATVAEQDVALGQVVLHAYMYSSKLVKVSRQLLQDSAFDINSWLASKLSTRIGRITNTHFTNGDGAAKPYGLAVQAASGVTAAATTDFTVDELVTLKHSVDPDYRENAQWMFRDAVLSNLKKKKDGEGRPLWQSGITMGAPDTIDGDPYVVNQDMPALTSGLRPIAYGDLSYYYIRDVLGVQLLRLDERYADNLQVGFLAFSRHDGVLVDAGTNPVKVLTLG